MSYDISGIDDRVRIVIEIVLGVITFFLTRTLKQIDADLRHLRVSAHDIRNQMHQQSLKIAHLEEWMANQKARSTNNRSRLSKREDD